MRLTLSTTRVTQGLVAAVAVIHLLNFPTIFWGNDHPRYNVLFRVYGEGRLGTYYSGLTLLVCAGLLLLIAIQIRRTNGAMPYHWFGLGAVFAYMSLDEVMSLHEMTSGMVRQALGMPGFERAWLIPAAVFLLVMAAIYFPFLKQLPSRTRALFLAAGTIYVTGAAGMELAQQSYLRAFKQDEIYLVISSLEEVLEMAGIVVFVFGLMDYLEKRVKEMQVSWVP